MKRSSRLVPLTVLALGTAAMLGAAAPTLAQGTGGGQGAGQGMGQGMGQGIGQGMGQGMGPGAGQGTRGAALFDRMDADDDGSISVEEFTARARARFADLDTDGDGKISAEEAENLGPRMRGGASGRNFARGGDPDDRPMMGQGRGGCSAAGYGDGMGYGRHHGRGMMGHGCGMQEACGMQGGYGMGQGMHGRGMQGQGMHGRGMQGRGMQGQGMPGGGYGMFGGMQGTGPMGYGGFGDPTLSDEERAERAARLVEMLDADGDGALSAEELASRPGPQMIFDRIDADGDGTISQEEFDDAVEQFGGRMGFMRGQR